MELLVQVLQGHQELLLPAADRHLRAMPGILLSYQLCLSRFSGESPALYLPFSLRSSISIFQGLKSVSVIALWHYSGAYNLSMLASCHTAEIHDTKAFFDKALLLRFISSGNSQIPGRKKSSTAAGLGPRRNCLCVVLCYLLPNSKV
jgi:hypothetical protein